MRKIIVYTYDLDSKSPGTPEQTKTIDHDNSSDRKWLQSHTFWAMRNGREVTLLPES